MAANVHNHLITSAEQLEAVFPDAPVGNAITKEIDHINASYRALIEASPFFAFATAGPEGLDCSPRGDPPGFVRVQDERTLLIPDRDPRVALLFLIPGVGETIRVNGRASISTDPALAESFAVNGKMPCTVIVVAV